MDNRGWRWTVVVLLAAAAACATETEHFGVQILPAPGRVVVDGQTPDWDLSGGVLACSDVENLRDQLACWFHAMYDQDHLYLLARWIDQTPLNNPGSVKGDYGFAGDCLQVRTITAPGDAARERTAHLTAWRDRDGVDVIDVAYGKQFNQGGMKDAKVEGAQQQFRVNADGKGYVQEIAMPWKLLAKDGYVPPPGGQITITLEPNFGTEARMRISMKEIFKEGVVPDRVFTFMSSQCWGVGTLAPKGRVPPRPVRLTDGREFKVHLEQGVPVVDWTGLIRVKELLGFKPVAFTMPADGYVSLQVVNAQGEVVRQLLNTAFMTRGEHVVKWDGLTTPNWRQPGNPVPAGDYAWRGLWHTGLGLRLRGWAGNGGKCPWDSPDGKGNWGGDHGQPIACASDGQKVYLGWSGAEAGKALIACDLDGNVLWRVSRQGMSGALLVAVDAGTVYSMNWDGLLFRVDSEKGGFTDWAGSGSTDLNVDALTGEKLDKDEHASSLTAGGGQVFVGYARRNVVLVVDGKTGKLVTTWSVPQPGDLELGKDQQLYVLSDSRSVLRVNPQAGTATPVVTGLTNGQGLALDADGRIYVGVRELDQQVKVFDAKGTRLGTIGRQGGRALLGKWTPDGMAFISGMAVDGRGQLWVMETDDSPKRVSVWDVKTGKLVRDFFGATAYGARGGAISPLDPLVMVGQGCEWRLDPVTGRGACTAVITREGMSNSRFAVANGGRLYLATAANWAFNMGPVAIYERVGDADYRLRTRIYHLNEKGEAVGVTGHGQALAKGRTVVWADANGDGQEQPEERTGVDAIYSFSGWYMGATPDLTIYSGQSQFKVSGFTACGAPRYDLSQPVKMPAPGLGSADGKLVLQVGDYGQAMSWFQCWDVASGKRLWTYPDNFVGVHGSHLACPPEVGMIRGSFGPCGTAQLPPPIGSIWVIPTNVGEWHVLTEQGFYLSRFFQGDPMKVAFPEVAAPGALVDNVPPGMGGEDFGGSFTCSRDGRMFLQAGKTAFWNVEVVGLETVKALPGQALSLNAQDVADAERFRGRYLQEVAGVKKVGIVHLTPTFTGDLAADFKGAELVAYQKQDDAAVRSVVAWDDQNLYLGWDVKDKTPWLNAGKLPEEMYLAGDTVDFQLGTNPQADRQRTAAVAGDLRLSIGNLGGNPTAVLYRQVATVKKPKTFSSGVVREFRVDYVDVVALAAVKVTVEAGKRYVVEVSVPLAALALQPAADLVLTGDFGVTHGGPDNQRTRLRTYWSNQVTGIVDDAVFELQLEPRNWGELTIRR